MNELYLGMGAFETINLYQGQALFLPAHLARLSKALNFLEISSEVTSDMINSYVKEHQLQDGVLKIIVTKERIDYSVRVNPYTKSMYKIGRKLALATFPRNQSTPFVYHKTLNYGECIWSLRHAVASGYDDALFFNQLDQICESTVGNIFLLSITRYIPLKLLVEFYQVLFANL